MIKKTCTKCKVDYEVSASYDLIKFFDMDKQKKDGFHSQCKLCRKSDKNLYYKNNTNLIRNKRMRLDFGIDLDDYNRILELQNNLCAICENSPLNSRRFNVDHCHKTGRVRGLLCDNCNLGIGKFKDDTTLLKYAISYLISKNDHRTCIS